MTVKGARNVRSVYGVLVEDALDALAKLVPLALVPDPADAALGSVEARLLYGVELPGTSCVLRRYVGPAGGSVTLVVVPSHTTAKAGFVVENPLPGAQEASAIALYLGARGVCGRVAHYTLLE